MTREIKFSDHTIRFEDTPAVRDAVFERVIKFYTDHDNWSGEGISQCDGPQIEAPTLLADIADDIIKFDPEWSD